MPRIKLLLTKEDKDFLRQKGYSIKDVAEIDYAASRSRYFRVVETQGETLDVPISAQQAVDILGKELWLSGISRSTFHWTCSRISSDGTTVRFDSSSAFSR